METQARESVSEASDSDQAIRLIDSFVKELDSSRGRSLGRVDIKSYPSVRIILELSSDQQVAVVIHAIARQTEGMPRFRVAGFKEPISVLRRKNLPFRLEDVNRLVDRLSGGRLYSWQLSLAGIMRVLENFCREAGIPDCLRPRLAALRDYWQAQPEFAETRNAVKRLDQLLTPAPAAARGSLLATEEAWTRYLRGQVDGLESLAFSAWQALLLHCNTASQSKPSRKWLQQAGGLVAEIGPAASPAS